MAVRRVVAYAGGGEVAASRDFYVEVLGMRVAMEDPVLDLVSPDGPAAEADRRGLRVAYPLTEEPWGVRRFFVEDPGGTIVNVLAHTT
jgi:hypothetical protein